MQRYQQILDRSLCEERSWRKVKKHEEPTVILLRGKRIALLTGTCLFHNPEHAKSALNAELAFVYPAHLMTVDERDQWDSVRGRELKEWVNRNISFISYVEWDARGRP